MSLIDVDDNPELLKELQACCNGKPETEYEKREDIAWKIAVDQWKTSKSRLDYWKEDEQIHRDRLIELTNSRNCRGFGIRAQYITRNGNIDYSSVPQLIDVDLEKYRKPASESWRITVDE